MNLTVQEINSKIYEVRGMKVMLDSDLSQRVQAQGQSCIKWKQKF